MDTKLELVKVVDFIKIVDEDFVKDIFSICQVALSISDIIEDLEIEKEEEMVKVLTKDYNGYEVECNIYNDGCFNILRRGEVRHAVYQYEIMQYYLSKGYYTIRSFDKINME